MRFRTSDFEGLTTIGIINGGKKLPFEPCLFERKWHQSVLEKETESKFFWVGLKSSADSVEGFCNTSWITKAAK